MDLEIFLRTGSAKLLEFSIKFQVLNPAVMLKAANGKAYPAVKVFAHALRFFKEHVLAELSDQSTAKILEDDITWVLTVPAIWRQPAKQFMRTAAHEVMNCSLPSIFE